ncbi:FAR1-RELATED SEQUENCE 5-like protein [Drosera capensis]
MAVGKVLVELEPPSVVRYLIGAAIMMIGVVLPPVFTMFRNKRIPSSSSSSSAPYSKLTKQPLSIITDQDEAMIKAIKKVFPSSRHRFCAWHVQKHVEEQLQSVRSQYGNFEEAHEKWVKSHNIGEFKSNWNG